MGATTDKPEHTVEVEDLRVDVTATGSDIVEDLSLALRPGEVLGIVGESGSGKTTVATALLGHARGGATISHGRIRIGSSDILALDEAGLRSVRGKLVAYMPQDPAASLNPALRIKTQLAELFIAHDAGSDKLSRKARIEQVLGEVGLPSDDEFLSRFPHQLSGGQQQRCAIAMAFLLRPTLIVLDEPTTGLDVTTQARVLETIKELCAIHKVAAVYITHDLAVVAELADRVMVMYAGRLVELGARRTVFDAPAHPYTAKLLGAIPEVERRTRLETIPGYAPAPGERPVGCSFAPRCPMAIDVCREVEPEVRDMGGVHLSRCHRAEEVLQQPPQRAALATPQEARKDTPSVIEVKRLSAWYGPKKILHDVSLELHQGECLVLVGESGSGKTTLSRAIVGLVPKLEGEILYNGEPLKRLTRKRPVDQRRAIQYIFQSPYNSLNPRKTIGQIVATPLEIFSELSSRETTERVRDALARVSLSAAMMGAYPRQLSGGERQRVAIARALVTQPKILICDEITSALDVSVQASIVELLRQLRETEELSMLFVTHNLALVRSIADRVLVMHHGRLIEEGATEAVLGTPQQEYTRQLLRDTPSINSATAPDQATAVELN